MVFTQETASICVYIHFSSRRKLSEQFTATAISKCQANPTVCMAYW